MEEDTDREDLPDLHVITIMYSMNDCSPPVVDLGLTSPWLAVTLLNQAAEYLGMTLIPPTVTYRGSVIFEAVDEEIDGE